MAEIYINEEDELYSFSSQDCEAWEDVIAENAGNEPEYFTRLSSVLARIWDRDKAYIWLNKQRIGEYGFHEYDNGDEYNYQRYFTINAHIIICSVEPGEEEEEES